MTVEDLEKLETAADKAKNYPNFIRQHLKMYYRALDRGNPESYMLAVELLTNDLKYISK